MANYTVNEAWPGTVIVQGLKEQVALFTVEQARKAIRITTLRAQLLAACNMTNDVEEFISMPKCIKIVPVKYAVPQEEPVDPLERQ